MTFARVPAGTLLMGDDLGEPDEKPQRSVEIPTDFWIGWWVIANLELAG